MEKGLSIISNEICNIFLDTEDIFEMCSDDIGEIMNEIKMFHDRTKPILFSIDGVSVSEENVAEKVLCLCREIIEEIEVEMIIDLGIVCLVMKRITGDVVIEVVGNRCSMDMTNLVGGIIRKSFLMYADKINGVGKESISKNNKNETMSEIIPLPIQHITRIVGKTYFQNIECVYNGEYAEFQLKDGNRIKIKIDKKDVTIFTFDRLLCEHEISECLKEDYNIRMISLVQ